MMIPQKIYQSFCETGGKWADAHCTASQMEDQLKPMLASLSLEARDVTKCSMAEAKEIGLSSSQYRDALKAASEARREANRAKVMYDATKSLFDAQRTVQATERAALSGPAT